MDDDDLCRLYMPRYDIVFLMIYMFRCDLRMQLRDGDGENPTSSMFVHIPMHLAKQHKS
jgi:hypothetical protein